jgi:GR25 family glycosyltransferase involved in LPS biosynthesis
MIPIFCINLQRAIKRKEYIEEEWINRLGFNITFWKGYDRRDIENNKFVYSYDKQLAINSTGRQLSHGEIACATSYCMLYEYLINNNYEEVVIMEDDIVPNFIDKSILFDTINHIQNEFNQTEMILLHDINPSQNKLKDKIFYEKKIYGSLCKITPWGNLLFYIKLNSIKKNYSILKEMKMPADFVQNILAKENLVCISNNPLCYHEYLEVNDTYIGNEFRNTKRRFIK